MKHTPGPWGCIDTSNHAHDYRLIKPDGSPLPLHVEANDHSEQRANARLIAAAPDLLEALQEITSDYADRFDLDDPSTNPGIKSSIEQARAAISKATGEQP
jgi:hypothetical protein